MRRLAAELGVAPMSLYRHVPDKDELLRLMADTALGEATPPEPGPDGWRAKLELLARLQWGAYRRHSWLAPTVLNSLMHPPVVVNGLLQLDWALRALAGLGLPARTMLHTTVTVNGYVAGIAVSQALEVETEQATGMSGKHPGKADEAMLAELFESGRFPTLSSMGAETGQLDDLDELFEFGLQRQLDGIAALLANRSAS
jgi:AcrR family transcriptional regulator